MNLHLVFSKSILDSLTEALRMKDYTVSGSDVTLEQFEIAATAGKIDANIALVDAAIGVAHKRESIRLLKQIRASVPDLRLIVLIPQEDEDWRRTLGMYGIYDVYTTEHFAVEDVQAWIETKKTIADVPSFGVERPTGQREVRVESQSQFTKESRGMMQSIQAAVQRFTGLRRVSRVEENLLQEVEGSTSVSEEIIQEAPREATSDVTAVPQVKSVPPAIPPMSQPYTVAVGALAARSGNTHTAIQIAFEAARQYKTALVEYQSHNRTSDLVSFASDFDGLKFERKGIAFFPNRTAEDVMEVYAMDYEVIVLDLGVLVELTEGKPRYLPSAQEFLRSQAQYVTISAAPWDLNRWVRHVQDVQMLTKRASIIVNYADDEMYRECKELFTFCSSPLLLNVMTANPFTDEGHLTEGHLKFWIDEEQKMKKKRWFIH